MDLNQLLFQHQRAIIQSGTSHSGAIAPEPAESRFDLIGHYAERIRRLREEMGVSVYPAWLASAA